MAEDDGGPGYSVAQQITLSVLGFTGALLSAIGSSCILSIILRDSRHKLKRTYHRLLLGLSVVDINNSLRGMMAGFLMPVDTPDRWYAYGNGKTCEALGFFVQLGAASALYNGCLATYFFMVVQPKLKGYVPTVEPFMHFFCIMFPLSTAIAGLPMALYNPVETGVTCWVASYPQGCTEDPDMDCTRGENAAVIGMIFGAFPLGLSLIVVTTTMTGLYIAVWRQMKVVEERYSTVAGQNKSLSSSHRLKQTRSQAQLYVGAYILSYVWIAILRIMEAFDIDGNKFGFVIVAEPLYQLQGFWNFFIYIRPRYLDLRRENPELSRLKTLTTTILETKGRSVGGASRSSSGKTEHGNTGTPARTTCWTGATHVIHAGDVENLGVQTGDDDSNGSIVGHVCDSSDGRPRKTTMSEDSFELATRSFEDMIQPGLAKMTTENGAVR